MWRNTANFILNKLPHILGYKVNNKPMEEIRMAKGNWWSSDSSRQCVDQWQAYEAKTNRPTCGYAYTSRDVRQPDGTYKKVKTREWDSQVRPHLFWYEKTIFNPLFCLTSAKRDKSLPGNI